MKDYYSIIGVPHDATPEQIKEAYRILAKVWHPDRFGGQHEEKIRKFAEERFKEVNEAYEVLSDPVKRAAYDQEFIVPKPKPVVSSTRIDFGKAKKGEVVRRSFQIDNQGGPPSKIDIDYPSDSWFQVRVRSVSDDTFPLEVEVIVDAETLKEGEYASKVTVSLDGEKAEVELFLKVEAVRARKPSPAPTWSASPATTSAPGPAWADFLMFNWLVPTGPIDVFATDPIDDLAGCLAFIFFFILAAILTITIGIPLWLLKKGWEKWKGGDRATAFVAWGGAATIVLVYIAPFWSAHQQELARERATEELRLARETATQETINSLEAVSITSTLVDVRSWGEIWEFSIQLKNNGRYPLVLYSISDYPTPYDSSEGCYAADDPGNATRLFTSGTTPPLYWVSRFSKSDNLAGFREALLPGTTATYSCSLEASHEVIFKEGMHLRIYVLEDQEEWDEIGRGWLEIKV